MHMFSVDLMSVDQKPTEANPINNQSCMQHNRRMPTRVLYAFKLRFTSINRILAVTN